MRKLVGLIGILFVLIACEKSIEIDLNDQSDKLVMYSFVYPDSALKLHFSKSQSTLSVKDYELVDKGRFRMYINEEFQGSYVFPSDTVWGEWEAFNFSKGDKIRIEAYELEGDTVIVESYLPSLIQIAAVDTNTIKKNDSEKGELKFLQAKVSFTDPPAQNNYYQLYLVRESWGEISGKSFHNTTVIEYDKNDPVFTQTDQSGSLLQGLDFQGLFDDRLLNGKKYVTIDIPEDEMYFDYYETKIKISIALYHHTIDYYSYLRTKIMADGYDGFYQGLPIFEPVQVHNNVSGGLGLVSGMSFHADSLVFIK